MSKKKPTCGECMYLVDDGDDFSWCCIHDMYDVRDAKASACDEFVREADE